MERSDAMSVVKPWTAALTAGLLASMTWLPQAARGELVFEDGTAPAAAPADAARVEERGVLRQALGTAERARDSRQTAVPAPATAPVQSAPLPVAAPVVAEMAPEHTSTTARAGDSVEDLRNMNKTELMRRERVREELRNEDALQERLEELRLRDEKRRTDQILGVSPAGAAGATGASGANGVNLPTPVYGELQEQAVSAPVTERPGQDLRQDLRQSPRLPQGAQAATGPTGGVQLAGISSVSAADQSASPSVITTSVDLEKSREKTVFSITPRAGLGGMSVDSGYEMKPRFAGGVSMGVATNDNLSFEVGYTYAEYGVNIASGNPFVQQVQYMQSAYGYNSNSNTLAFKQNVVDAGVRLHLLDSTSRVRPFVGGGAAWSKGYINYDQQILNALKQTQLYGNNPLTSDYELTSYMGYLSGGLDVKMSQSLSVGFMAKYYAVLSSSENGNLNNYAFYNPYYGGVNQAPEKQVVGGSLGKTNFYTLMGGLTFSF